jgi:hypothetical protein
VAPAPLPDPRAAGVGGHPANAPPSVGRAGGRSTGGDGHGRWRGASGTGAGGVHGSRSSVDWLIGIDTQPNWPYTDGRQTDRRVHRCTQSSQGTNGGCNAGVKIERIKNGNGRSRKWYENRKMLVKMEMIVILFHRIHVSTVFCWETTSELRIVIGRSISLGNIKVQHGPITQPYVYNFSLHSQSPTRGHDYRQQPSQ